MKTARLAGVVALLVGAALPTAFAGPIGSEVGPNLVTNGGFESNLSGWTASGFTGLDYDYGIDSVSHSGNNSFQGGAPDNLGFLSQTLATQAGTSYNIDLWLASDGFFEN